MVAVVLLIAVICIAWFYTMKLSERVTKEVNEHSRVQTFMKEKYIDHLLWLDALKKHVFQGAAFDKALDPHKCDFGKWYYDYKPSAKETEICKSIEEPHRKLHESARLIMDAPDRAKKEEILNNVSVPIVKEIKGLFDKLADIRKSEAENAQKGLQKLQGTINVLLWVLLGVVVVGNLGLCMPIMNVRVLRPLRDSVIFAETIASGDITKSITSDSKIKDEITDLLHALESMRQKLKVNITEMSGSSNQLASASEELSATVTQITHRIEEQTGKINQVATATTEMSQTVIDIAKNASNIATSANDTTKTAHDGEQVVGKTVSEVQEIARTVAESADLMSSLGERSKQIGEIINVIKDIADQTNLLALNAAIEAARAGEQGRGFAVVADEVRKLAERTAKATTEIGDMISAIQNETEKAVTAMADGSKRVEAGVALATEAGSALHKIVDSVNGLQSMVQQIASATEEMSAVSEQISGDIEAIAAVSNETSASAEQIAQASSDLARLSTEQKGIVRQFKL
jgi:methyl-accepting chemotaxis protein